MTNEYLKTAGLVKAGPWSAREIDRKIRRGELVEGTHFFVDGPRRQRIFKWGAVVDLIEHPQQAGIRKRTRAGVNIDEATAGLRRLLNRAA